MVGSRRHLFRNRRGNPTAAIQIDKQIVANVHRYVDFPPSGRVGRIAETRELAFNGTPYFSASEIPDTAVRILCYPLGAQELPHTLPTR